MSRQISQIHILGGGVAGLSAAQFCNRRFPQAKVTVYEAADRLGGRCGSYFDPHLDCDVDYATHLILGANRQIQQFLPSAKFQKTCGFYDLASNDLSYEWPRFLDHIRLSAFNTLPRQIPWLAKIKAAAQLFPFGYNQRKIAYSQQNLQTELIAPLSRFKGQILSHQRLLGFSAHAGCIDKLFFKNLEVSVGAQDRIICALDDRNYQRIFGGAKFAHSRIINVFFRTSMALTLPDDLPFIGVLGGYSHWIFTSPQLLGVTISAVAKMDLSKDQLAREVWREVSQIRGGLPAFLPPYRVQDYQYATILQDQQNNALRPGSSASNYTNMQLAGDWTLRNYPCCLEGAVLSAQRAVKHL